MWFVEPEGGDAPRHGPEWPRWDPFESGPPATADRRRGATLAVALGACLVGSACLVGMSHGRAGPTAGAAAHLPSAARRGVAPVSRTPRRSVRPTPASRAAPRTTPNSTTYATKHRTTHAPPHHTGSAARHRVPANAVSQARRAVTWALDQVGTPYQWGGTCTRPHGSAPMRRCDCSSLVQQAYRSAGILLDRTTYAQVHEGWAVPLDALRPGDLLFYEGSAARPEHVALYVGGGMVVQAPRPGRTVDVVRIAWNGRVLAARRVA